MTTQDAFRHLEMEIEGKRWRAEVLRKTRASRSQSRATLDGRARFLEEEAEAYEIVLKLARSAAK